MSYIDSCIHKYIANFNNLPLYLPLENLKGAEFCCTPRNLVLGGGSGEHPALVVHNLDGICSSYILDCLFYYEEKQNKIHGDDNEYFPSILINNLFDILNPEFSFELLEFNGWSMIDYHDFVCNAKNSNLNPDYLGKIDSMCSSHCEDWIMNSLGEFLFHQKEYEYLIPEIVSLKKEYPSLFERDDIFIRSYNVKEPKEGVEIRNLFNKPIPIF